MLNAFICVVLLFLLAALIYFVTNFTLKMLLSHAKTRRGVAAMTLLFVALWDATMATMELLGSPDAGISSGFALQSLAPFYFLSYRNVPLGEVAVVLLAWFLGFFLIGLGVSKLRTDAAPIATLVVAIYGVWSVHADAFVGEGRLMEFWSWQFIRYAVPSLLPPMIFLGIGASLKWATRTKHAPKSNE